MGRKSLETKRAEQKKLIRSVTGKFNRIWDREVQPQINQLEQALTEGLIEIINPTTPIPLLDNTEFQTIQLPLEVICDSSSQK